MRGDSIFLMFGIFCLWPLLIGALPTFLLMKYKVRIVARDAAPAYVDTTGATARATLRRIVKKDEAGYGG